MEAKAAPDLLFPRDHPSTRGQKPPPLRLFNMSGTEKALFAPPCPPPNRPPPPLPPPKSPTQIAHQQRIETPPDSPALRYPDIVVRDFSLPRSTYTNSLANPYGFEATADHTPAESAIGGVVTADTEGGKWPDWYEQLPFQHHTRKLVAAGERYPGKYLDLLRAMEELLRMAEEAESSDGESGSVSAVHSIEPLRPGGGDNTGTMAPALDHTPAETKTKPSLFHRAGKAISKKRSFWIGRDEKK
ncbi:hypothetical protein F4777DRAFT_582519 [Nemania sp. FL0916]|nr:hypothetical protein F4777DRAFT_582519 [Nemania sp. FL0916]